MARLPLPRARPATSAGRCDPPPTPAIPAPARAFPGQAPPRAESRAATHIPAAWLGLTEEEALAITARGVAAAVDSTRPAAPETVSLVIVPADATVTEHVQPVASWTERGGCVIEPGRPCRGSGRCRQRGY